MSKMQKSDRKLPISWRGEAEWMLSTLILLAMLAGMIWATITQASIA